MQDRQVHTLCDRAAESLDSGLNLYSRGKLRDRRAVEVEILIERESDYYIGWTGNTVVNLSLQHRAKKNDENKARKNDIEVNSTRPPAVYP
jgi:hypothetical protein